MKQAANTATRERMFPMHYKGEHLLVYSTQSGELFVEDIRTRVSMRISPSKSGGLQFTTHGRVEPVRVTNMIGWRIEPR